MVRGIVNRAVGAVLLALFIVMIGGCGSSGQAPATRVDTATVRGEVIGPDQLPLLDARVRVGSIIAHVDRAGRFAATVAPGRYELSIAADGYQAFSETVTLAAGDNDLGEVRLASVPPLPRV